MNGFLLLIIGEVWDPGRVEVIEMAIENIEAEVAHLGPGYAWSFQRLGDGARGLILFISIVLLEQIQ